MKHQLSLANLAPLSLLESSCMEHRCGTRHEVNIAVYARSHGGVVSSVGWLRNISASGGFLCTTLSIDPPAHISLRLVDADEHFPARIEGHVVRRAPNGLGIEWAEYAPEWVRHLDSVTPAQPEPRAETPKIRPSSQK